MVNYLFKAVVKKYSLFALITLVCYACSSPQQQKQPEVAKIGAAKVRSLPIMPYTVIRADYSIDIFGNDDLRPAKTTVYTFNRCKLLARPDSTATALKPLSAFVPLTYLKSIRLQQVDTLAHYGSANDSITEYMPSFYEVRLGTQKGYVAAADVAQYSITDKAGNALYLLGTDYRAADYKHSFIIKKVDLKSRQLVATAYRSLINDAVLDVMLIKGHLLPEVKSMIKIVGHADMCGGGQTTVYLAEAGRKLVALPDAFQAYDDSGAIFNEWIFLPRQSAQGQWTLKTDTLGEQGSGSLKILTDLPTKLSVEQLIAYTCIEGQLAMDKNNQPIILKNRRSKLDGALTLTTRYYQWTGQKLVPLPGTKKVKLNNSQFEAYF
jgi:hypothetical protein